MKKKLYSALLILILAGSVLISQAQYTNGWINNFGGIDAGGIVQTQDYNSVAYSVITDLNNDQTFVIATSITGEELWDYDFDYNEPEGRVLRIQTTQHGLVVMGSKSISLLDYGSGVKLYNYEFDDEQALDDDFYGGGVGNFEFSHRNVWETDTSLIFVGVMHNTLTETWTVHVKHANLTGGYYWEYEVLSLTKSPMMSYGRANSFTINHLDGNILNIYHMNLTSGSLGQFPELEDLSLPITGDWTILTQAEMDSEKQYLLIYNSNTVYYYAIVFDNYAEQIFSYPKDFSNVHTILEEFFSCLCTNNYSFVSTGNEMLYRTDGLYTNLLSDGGSSMMRGSPRMIALGNNLLVIYNDDDDLDTHILYYDQNLNLLGSQVFGDYEGISQFMYGAVAGAGDDFYLYGYQRESWDPYIIFPSLSYWSGGGLVSISEINAESEILIYPNPTSDYLMIDSQDNNVQWELYAITGQIMMRGAEKQINMSKLETGCYVLRIITGSGPVLKKILKQ